ncbi:MAG: ATP synthase F0 subunit B [Bradymonadaceae bacterium]
MLNLLAAPSLPVVAAAAIDIDGTVLVQMLVFLFVIIFLHYVLYRPYLRTLDLRTDAVQGSREEAGELDARAAMLVTEYDEKILNARREAKEVRDSLRTQGLSEQGEIVDEVRDELAAKLAEERTKIAGQVEEATRQIKTRSEGLAEAMVNRILPSV